MKISHHTTAAVCPKVFRILLGIPSLNSHEAYEIKFSEIFSGGQNPALSFFSGTVCTLHCKSVTFLDQVRLPRAFQYTTCLVQLDSEKFCSNSFCKALWRLFLVVSYSLTIRVVVCSTLNIYIVARSKKTIIRPIMRSLSGIQWELDDSPIFIHNLSGLDFLRNFNNFL